MLGSALLPEIKDLIAARDFATLRDALCSMEPVEVAEILMEIPAADSAVVFRVLPKAFAADVFEFLTIEDQEEILRALGHDAVAGILNEMAPDARTALLEELPPAVTERLLNLLTNEQRTIARTLLGYPEGSVGRLMTTEYVRLKQDMTIEQAIAHIRQFGVQKETVNNLYVTDPKGVLIDDIKLRELVLAKPDARVSDIMDHSFTSLRASDPQEEAVRTFEKFDRNALPVVDSGGVLVGIVTVDDILDVAQEEATEDMQRMGGVQALETSYLEASVAELVKKRVGWLVVLFFGQMLTEAAMTSFQSALDRAVVVALFVPLVISSGGNSGSQAATLIIRAMAVGEVTLADWWRIMRREIFCGLALGGILGAIIFARIVAWAQVSPDTYGPHYLLVAVTLSLSILGVVLWGSLAGSMLPMALRAMKLDPATASTPFVATLSDVTGILIYLTVATLVLSGTLL